MYIRIAYSSVAQQSVCGTEKYFQGGQVAGYTLWILSSVA
jgi:hypothetical protein